MGLLLPSGLFPFELGLPHPHEASMWSVTLSQLWVVLVTWDHRYGLPPGGGGGSQSSSSEFGGTATPAEIFMKLGLYPPKAA